MEKKKSQKPAIIISVIALILAAAALFLTLRYHTYEVDMTPQDLNDVWVFTPNSITGFYDMNKYYTGENPTNDVWTNWQQAFIRIKAYYDCVKDYKVACHYDESGEPIGNPSKVIWTIEEKERDYMLVHFEGTAIRKSDSGAETVDDYWIVDLAPFWKGEEPNVYKLETVPTAAAAYAQWEEEHPDYLERNANGDYSMFF